MSRPFFLVDALPDGSAYTLAGPEGHHAAAVQRLGPGAELVLADGRGGTVDAVVAAAGRGTLTVALGPRQYAEPPDPRLVVVQALAKGDRGELAVQAMTEVGVDEIVPWAARRCVVQWRGERGERAGQKWAATAREAAKQSRRAFVPPVAPAAASTAAVADRCAAAAAAFVLHGAAAVRLATVDLPGTGEIVLVVGPEGGIAPDELAAFTAAGARPARLGATILRTSTAAPAALAVLSARLARW